MTYTVLWRPTAERQLADIWLNAADRAAVTASANWIDQQLRHDPANEGESRDGKTRIFFVPPLVIFFEVDEAGRTVYVRLVARSRRTT
jgi:plasmid stabilization system protein ParE